MAGHLVLPVVLTKTIIMKKKPVENVPNVTEDELIISHEEPVAIQVTEEQIQHATEAQSNLTANNVIKTRH